MNGWHIDDRGQRAERHAVYAEPDRRPGLGVPAVLPTAVRVTFPGLEAQTARFAVAEARYGLGGVLASLPACLYVNHPHRIGDAEFKPSGLPQPSTPGCSSRPR